jgi:H+/Cl- antiporter ClcA
MGFTLRTRQLEIQLANKRASSRLRTSAIATAARYDRRTGRIFIQLSTGLQVAFRPNDAQGLENAKAQHLCKIEITPSGLGIHFPQIDADIYLPALLGAFLGSKRWMASALGKAGGKAMSDAKRAAARRNGKLGGRPKKATGLQAVEG